MERIGEAESSLPDSCSLLVNVHGDEPLLDPSHVNDVVAGMRASLKEDRVVAFSLRKRIFKRDVMDRGVIKVPRAVTTSTA